jgi:hypothetical protein
MSWSSSPHCENTDIAHSSAEIARTKNYDGNGKEVNTDPGKAPPFAQFAAPRGSQISPERTNRSVPLPSMARYFNNFEIDDTSVIHIDRIKNMGGALATVISSPMDSKRGIRPHHSAIWRICAPMTVLPCFLTINQWRDERLTAKSTQLIRKLTSLCEFKLRESIR